MISHPWFHVEAHPEEWTAPDCDLFASDCPILMELPEAYLEVEGGGYTCAEGFAGTAVARCVPDEECKSSLQWFGDLEKYIGIIRNYIYIWDIYVSMYRICYVKKIYNTFWNT